MYTVSDLRTLLLTHRILMPVYNQRFLTQNRNQHLT
nr:MAG TPA: hypothetical protein [Caudoviricetes sp.]